jgi:simple sugar transport system ATP-binding protein
LYAVELENISKTFSGGVQANRNITLRIKKGEVHGLLGENGAGKSTLMNVLYGLLQSDDGRIIINGSEVRFNSPHDAIAQKIGMVHQHFKLIPTLTVAENVVLGMEPKSSKPTKSGLGTIVLLSAFSIILMGLFLPVEQALLGALILLLSVVILYHIFRMTNPSERLGLNRLGRLGFVLEQIGSIIATLSQNLMPIGYGDAIEKIKHIAEENGLDIDPMAKVEDISVGLQQRVEIIKTLYREADILILDEPTSVLTPQEVDELFVTLERFREAGKTIILITHKLREPMALCDRISVLRDGELVGTVEKAGTSPEELAQMMVGRPVVFRVEKTPAAPSDVVLDVKNLEVLDNRNLLTVKGISIQVRSGEILGIAGVQGNGQTELVEAIVGLRKLKSGSVRIAGDDITGASPRKVRAVGVSHIPEDRQKRGLVLGFTVEENLALGQQYLAPYAKGPLTLFLDLESIQNISQETIDNHSIKVLSSKSLASTLSGGNQQKVIVARELGTKPRLVIAAQPTRGLDVGATEFIHKELISMRDAGVAILLVSAELDEIRTLSDRIAVIFDGKIMAIRDSAETTPNELGLLMAGHESDLEEVSA